MLLLSEDDTSRALPFADLIDALADAFRSDGFRARKFCQDIKVPGEADATMVLSQSWIPGNFAVTKLVNLVPGNIDRGLPVATGLYLLSDARTGEMLALIDAKELVARRIAAISALAACYLAPLAAKKILVLGSGIAARYVALAFMSARSLETVTFWSPVAKGAANLAEDMQGRYPVNFLASTDLKRSLSDADVVCSTTTSNERLIKSKYLKDSVHLDLIGGFDKEFWDGKEEPFQSASLFVDDQDTTNANFRHVDIEADLRLLCRGQHIGRAGSQSRTVFKSSGVPQADLACAVLAYKNALVA